MMHLFRDISNKRSLKILCPNILIGTVDYEPFCFVIPLLSLFYAFPLFGRAVVKNISKTLAKIKSQPADFGYARRNGDAFKIAA